MLKNIRMPISLVGFICLSFTSLHSFKPQENTPQTNQQILPNGFAYFENPYFYGPSRTFFTVGKDVDLSKAIYTEEPRGFTWRQYPYFPYRSADLHSYFIPGTAAVIFERASTPIHFTHMFHFLEQLLGIWNFKGEQLRSDVNLFLIASNGEMTTYKNWKGPNNITFHLIKALFPNAEIKVWEDFIKETGENLLCFEKMITADRCMEYRKKEPYKTERLLGGYFQSLTNESLEQLALAVHDYAKVHIVPSEKLRVTYLIRPAPRCLTSEENALLTDKIKQLPNVELQIIDFATITFQEQVNIAANTDVLLGLHGMGLSHSLFLPKGATLIELFPKDCYRVEFCLFSKARQLHYFAMVPNHGWITGQTNSPWECFGDLLSPVTGIDSDGIITILQQCKKASPL